MQPLFQDSYYSNITITVSDIFFLILIIVITWALGRIYASNKIKTDSTYKYFMAALMIKMASVMAFCIIYMTAYGGDTQSYFHNMSVLRNLFFEDPAKYFDIVIHNIDKSKFYYFNWSTGYPNYMWKDSNSYLVARLLSPLAILTNNSFLISSLIVSILSFFGGWKLFLLFTRKYYDLKNEMAIACLYLPSVLFWGSGIMKDTIIVFCLAFILISIDKFTQFKFSIKQILIFTSSAWIIILIKPYVIIALIPCLIIWISYDQYRKIASKFVRYALTPIFIATIFVGVFFIFSRLSTSLGSYGDVDSIIDRAKIIQEDLVRAEQYGENSFYIGEITGSTTNLMSLFPKAVMAGLFRPYIWESRNVFMLMSGVENFLILLLFINVFFRRKIRVVFLLIGKDPFLLGLLMFALFLAFGIGLSSSNFGALVRYRIPLMPMLVAGLFIIRHYYQDYLKSIQPEDRSFMIPFRKK